MGTRTNQLDLAVTRILMPWNISKYNVKMPYAANTTKNKCS